MFGYLGSYLGSNVTTVTVTIYVAGTPATVPVPSPYTPTSPQYYDHVSQAISRLCEYAKAKAS